MKRHLEEQIIGYAYGELNATDAEAIRELIESSEEARALYESYQVTASAISQLPSAPQPSLSCERLQQAILSRNLKQGAKLNGLFGGLATVAVAGAIFLVVNRMGSFTSDEGKSVGAKSSFEQATAMNEGTGSSSLAPEISAPTGTKTVIENAARSARPATRTHARSRSRASYAETFAELVPPTDLGAAISGAAENGFEKTEPADKAGVGAPDASLPLTADAAVNQYSAGESDQIVLISSGNREVDGTTKATESRVPDGVSIGG